MEEKYENIDISGIDLEKTAPWKLIDEKNGVVEYIGEKTHSYGDFLYVIETDAIISQWLLPKSTTVLGSSQEKLTFIADHCFLGDVHSIKNFCITEDGAFLSIWGDNNEAYTYQLLKPGDIGTTIELQKEKDNENARHKSS